MAKTILSADNPQHIALLEQAWEKVAGPFLEAFKDNITAEQDSPERNFLLSCVGTIPDATRRDNIPLRLSFTAALINRLTADSRTVESTDTALAVYLSPPILNSSELNHDKLVALSNRAQQGLLDKAFDDLKAMPPSTGQGNRQRLLSFFKNFISTPAAPPVITLPENLAPSPAPAAAAAAAPAPQTAAPLGEAPAPAAQPNATTPIPKMIIEARTVYTPSVIEVKLNSPFPAKALLHPTDPKTEKILPPLPVLQITDNLRFLEYGDAWHLAEELGVGEQYEGILNQLGSDEHDNHFGLVIEALSHNILGPETTPPPIYVVDGGQTEYFGVSHVHDPDGKITPSLIIPKTLVENNGATVTDVARTLAVVMEMYREVNARLPDEIKAHRIPVRLVFDTKAQHDLATPYYADTSKPGKPNHAFIIPVSTKIAGMTDYAEQSQAIAEIAENVKNLLFTQEIVAKIQAFNETAIASKDPLPAAMPARKSNRGKGKAALVTLADLDSDVNTPWSETLRRRYESRIAEWEKADKGTRGKRPEKLDLKKLSGEHKLLDAGLKDGNGLIAQDKESRKLSTLIGSLYESFLEMTKARNSRWKPEKRLSTEVPSNGSIKYHAEDGNEISGVEYTAYLLVVWFLTQHRKPFAPYANLIRAELLSVLAGEGRISGATQQKMQGMLNSCDEILKAKFSNQLQAFDPAMSPTMRPTEVSLEQSRTPCLG